MPILISQLSWNGGLSNESIRVATVTNARAIPANPPNFGGGYRSLWIFNPKPEGGDTKTGARIIQVQPLPLGNTARALGIYDPNAEDGLTRGAEGEALAPRITMSVINADAPCVQLLSPNGTAGSIKRVEPAEDDDVTGDIEPLTTEEQQAVTTLGKAAAQHRENKMSEPKVTEAGVTVPEPLLKVIEDDARAAAFRLAAKQFTKLTREPLVAAVAGHLGPNDPSMRAKVAAFLDTEAGEAIITTLIATGLFFLPNVMGDTQARMAKEFRVKALFEAGDFVADLLMGPLREALAEAIRGAPKETSALPSESVSHPPVNLELLKPMEAPQPAGQEAKVGSR